MIKEITNSHESGSFSSQTVSKEREREHQKAFILANLHSLLCANLH